MISPPSLRTSVTSSRSCHCSTTAILFREPDLLPARRLLREHPLGHRQYLRRSASILPASKELLFLGEIPHRAAVGYAVVAVILFAIGWLVYGAGSRGFADVV